MADDSLYAYDGDTLYSSTDPSHPGIRVRGADTTERRPNDPGWREGRAALSMALGRGYQPGPLIEHDDYDREVRAIVSPDGTPHLGAAMLGAGIALPVGDKLAPGTRNAQFAEGVDTLLGTQPQGIAADPAFQQLAEDARRARLERFDALIGSGVTKGFLNEGQQIADPMEERGDFHRAALRGTDQMQATFYGFTNALGELIGSERVAEFGAQGVADNLFEAMRNPARVATYEDIESLADVGTYVIEALGEFAPQLAIDGLAAIGTGGAAVLAKSALAGVGKAALRNLGGSTALGSARQLAVRGVQEFGFKAGAKFGAFASMYAQSTGETQMELQSEGIDSPETAFLVGGAKAALDYAALSKVMGGVAGRFGDEAADSLPKVLGSASVAVAKGVLNEGPTEAVQTLMDEYAKAFHKDDYEIDTTSIIDAGLKGAVAGGGVQGGGTLAVDAARYAVKKANDGYRAGLDDAAPTSEPADVTPAAVPADAVPAATDPVQDTAPEPRRDIEAQVANTPEGEGNWFTAENAEAAREVAAQQGAVVKELPDGSVAVGAPEVLDALPDNPTQADIARLNGYMQTKDEAASDPAGAVVVETRTPDGAVLRNQMVGASVAEAAVAQQKAKFPGATVEVKSLEAAVGDRARAVAEERPRATVDTSQVRVTGMDAESTEQLVERARSLGIDPSRFQQVPAPGAQSLGEQLVPRLSDGLRAVVRGGSKRRLDSVESLASLLGMEPEALRRTHYDAKNVIQGREKLFQAVQARIAEKFGTEDALVDAVNRLPVAQVQVIRDELGLDGAAGFDVAALRGEIAARAPRGNPTPMDEANVTARARDAIGLDDPIGEPAQPVAKPQADVIRDAVFDNPGIRQLLAGEDGTLVRGDELDTRIDELGTEQRLGLERFVKNLDIDVGGKNREQFLELLRESLVGETAYGIGSEYVDARATDPGFDDESGARIVVQTEDFNPSLLDGDNARFYQLIESTPLSDRSKDGWSAGLSLYLEAFSRIAEANKDPEQSALSDDEAVRLANARVLGSALDLAAELAHGKGDRASAMSAELIAAVTREYGITPELAGKAAGRTVPAAETAVGALASRSDRRLARAVLTSLARSLVAADGMEMTDEQLRKELATALTNGGAEGVAVLRALFEAQYGSAELQTDADYYARAPLSEERAVTASAKGHDAGRFENAAVDGEMTGNEQQSSDDQFFRAVYRATIRDWPMALLPSPAQLSSIEMGSTLSKRVTQKFKGKNLLSLPMADGSEFGSVADAVALAMYAQSGERVPSTPGEAAVNLMENLSRLMAGPQNSHTERRVAQVIRNIPDDLVIFVDPVTGRGVTFGEGLNHRHALASASARQSVIRRELDELTGDINDVADVLDAFSTQLLEQTAGLRRQGSVIDAAVQRWIDMMAGSRDESGNYYGKPDRKDKKQAQLRKAMDSIGEMEVQDGETLDTLYNRYLSMLSRRKQLNAEARELAESLGAKREAPTPETQVAMSLGLDLDRDPKAMRQVNRALRGGQGTKVFTDDGGSIDRIRERGGMNEWLDEAEQQDYSLRALDPLGDIQDAEDLAQEAAIKAWLAAAGEPPLFRLASTAMADSKPTKGMTLDGLREVVEAFQAAYNGHIPLKFDLVQTQEEKYGPIPTDANGRPVVVKGAYYPAGRHTTRGVPGGAGDTNGGHADARPVQGRVVLIADNLRDEADVLETLRHEVLGHFGLNTFTPAVKRQILDAILASRNVPSLRSIWREIGVRYGDQSTDVQAEEVYAYIVEAEPQTAPTLLQRVVALIERGLRAMGLLKGKVTRAELETMARQIAAGIRDGRVRQRNFPQTDDASFRRALPNAGMLKAQAAQFWNKGVLPKVAPVVSMVHSRIGRYHAELARALFQPANAEASVHGQSWEQRNRAIKARMMAQVDRLMVELRQGQRGAKAGIAVQTAFEDAYSGAPKTEAGRKVRRVVDALVAEAQRSGLRSVELGENFAPIAFDRMAITSQPAEFEQLVRLYAGIEADEARELIRRIVDGPGVIEGAMAPGMPVGTHKTTRELVEAIGLDRLQRGGWLLAHHDAALFHWVDGVSKRAAWEAIFGGDAELKQDGGEVRAVFDPNLGFKRMIGEVRERHGALAEQEVMDLVNGALGRHPAGQSMPGWWRSTQDFITGWVGMTVLAFSGIASIPELAMPFVRSAGRVGLSDTVRDYQEARRFARDMGIVLSDASEQVMWQSTGDQYQSPFISKMQSWFFRLNGNELIVKTSRTLATGVAIRYLLAAAADGDKAALARLNIDAGTVHAWEQAGKPAWSADLDPATQVIAAKVGDAVNQFVNEATLNPSRFQATHWGNNPYLKMIWHLKHFLFTYGDTVLGGIWRETQRRWKHLDPRRFAQALAIAMPAVIFGVMVLPLAAASLELRDWIRRLNGQRGMEYDGALEYFGDVFSRAGGLGPVEFLLNMRRQQEYGASVFGSISPVLGKADMLFADYRRDGDRFGSDDLAWKLRQLIPVVSQNPGLSPSG